MRHGLAYLHRAVELYPDHRAARRNIAEFQLALGANLGDPIMAVVMADYLVEREPANPFHRLLLSRALAQAGERDGRRERFSEAESAALSCLDIAEPKGLVYRTAAQARMLAGDLAGAVELLDTSVGRGLDHSSVLLQRGELLLRLGRRPEGLRDLHRVLEQDPFEAQALRLLRSAAPPR
jgi:predicted Zn-dependent protease